MLDVTRLGTVATFHRVPYDVRAAAAAVRASDVPDRFAADIELAGRLEAATEAP